MYKKFNQHGLIAASLVGAVILILAVVLSSVDFMLRGSYFLLIVSGLAAIGLPIYYAVQNPKSLIRTGISVGVIAVLFFVIYLSSSSSDVEPQYLAQGITSGKIQISGAIITMTMIMVGLALVSIVATEIYSVLKK